MVLVLFLNCSDLEFSVLGVFGYSGFWVLGVLGF